MGRQPIPLNQKGIEQAQNVREQLKDTPLTAIYSSPMVRAMETASIIVEGRKNLPIIPEEGVAEINYGDWVGTTFDDVEKNYNAEYNAYRFKASTMKIPGGEAVIDVQRRGVAAIEKMKEKHQRGRVLVVSHADVIKAIIIHYLNTSLDRLQIVGCDNGSLSIFRFGTEWGDRLVALNYFADVQKVLPW